MGLTMEEAKIAQWLKKQGDPVKMGEPLNVWGRFFYRNYSLWAKHHSYGEPHPEKMGCSRRGGTGNPKLLAKSCVDHRLIDGVIVARLLDRIAGWLESERLFSLTLGIGGLPCLFKCCFF
jgi:hypothetical protein